jgi:hypothetical protein
MRAYLQKIGPPRLPTSDIMVAVSEISIILVRIPAGIFLFGACPPGSDGGRIRRSHP